MIFVRLLPVMLSALLLAAHLLRFHGLLAAIAFAALTITLSIRRSWVIRFWQSILFIGTLLWIQTTVNLIHMRISLNMPWIRLTVIMTAVIVLTIFSGFWLENRKIKAFYRRDD